MISDLFRSPCWSRKCLVRLPQFREHDYRGLITSPDPVLNRQKITRLCYDFCLRYGEWISKCRHLLDTFLLCVDVCFRSKICAPKWETKSQYVDTYFLCRVDIFSSKTYAHHLDEVTADQRAAKFNLYLRKGGSRQQHATFAFVDNFPDQTVCDFLDRFTI